MSRAIERPSDRSGEGNARNDEPIIGDVALKGSINECNDSGTSENNLISESNDGFNSNTKLLSLEGHHNNFLNPRIPKNIIPVRSVSTRQKIPRIIHQTFETNVVPSGMYQAAKSWADYNAEYEYRFYDAEDRISLIKENFGEEVLKAYHLIKGGAFKADLWRYCTLYLYGGVYADVDTVCARNLSRLIQDTDSFIVPYGNKSLNLYNAFICSIPRHPFLKRVIDRAVNLILQAEQPENLDMFSIVGPVGLGMSINLELGRERVAPYEVGKHCIGEYEFRILRKIVKAGETTRVVDSNDVVFFGYYKGYRQDLKSLSIQHWNDKIELKVPMSTKFKNYFSKEVKQILKKIPNLF